MTNELTRQHRAMGIMVICALLWSIGGLFIKLISWDPLLIAGIRSLIAAVVTGIYLKITGQKLVFNKLSFLSGLAVGSVCALFVFATKLTTAANAVVIQYSSPIWVLLIGTVFLKKPLHRRDIIVVLAAFIGMILFFMDQLSPGNMLGNFIAILSSVSLAGVFLVNGQAKDADAVRFTGILLGHSMCGLLTFVGLFLYPFQPTGAEIGYILILGIIQIAAPYILLAIASKNCPPLAGNLISMLEPVLNPVWVMLFYGEKPGFYALIGSAVIIIAVGVWTVADARASDGQ